MVVFPGSGKPVHRVVSRPHILEAVLRGITSWDLAEEETSVLYGCHLSSTGGGWFVEGIAGSVKQL